MTNKVREEWKVYKDVFDEFTLRTIHKLSSQGHFDELKSPIAVGKESNVYMALKGEKKVVAKIYLLQACNFKRMYDYIKQDERYTKLRKSRRQIIFSWVQREYRNIMVAREAGLDVPKPIAVLNNVLVLEFIGNESPAPRLKDEWPKNKDKFFNDVIENMKKLHKAGIVHADLSEYNILNWNDRPYFIDFSQGTAAKSLNADELLDRDIRNISKFFNKIGVKTSEEEIKKKII